MIKVAGVCSLQNSGLLMHQSNSSAHFFQFLKRLLLFLQLSDQFIDLLFLLFYIVLGVAGIFSIIEGLFCLFFCLLCITPITVCSFVRLVAAFLGSALCIGLGFFCFGHVARPVVLGNGQFPG